MPPKAKFTREEIIKAALEITKNEGIEFVTARSIAEKLHASPRPIFTVFQSMEEVLDETHKKMYQIYIDFLNEGFKMDIPFKGAGLQYIKFAKNEPNYFKVLFMENNNNSISHSDALKQGLEFNPIIEIIKKQYSTTKEKAVKVYQHLSIFCHGIASLIVTGACSFTDEEISQLLSEEFFAIKKEIIGQ